MTTIGMIQRPKDQHPVYPPVVYWSERIKGWWPDLPKRCPEIDCGGNLLAECPDTAPGSVSCLLCTRLVAEVLERRPKPESPIDWAPNKPGRPPSTHRVRAFRERQRTGVVS